MANWIERAINDDLKRRIKFSKMNREIIGSIDVETGNKKTKEVIFYRYGARYFISVDGKPVATALTKNECAKSAFLKGFITDTDYVTFTRGTTASAQYKQDKSKIKSLSGSERKLVDEVLNNINTIRKPANIEYR